MTYKTLPEADPAQPPRTPGVGRASEGQDFVPLLDSVVFLANQSEANISLQILDDEDPEGDESVFVELTGVQVVEAAQERLSKTRLTTATHTLCYERSSRTEAQFSFSILDCALPGTAAPWPVDRVSDLEEAHATQNSQGGGAPDHAP